jgi:hypothetical protein
MIIGLQIIAILFALSMIYFAVLHYKKGQLNGAEILAWLIMWTAAIIIIVFPELLRPFARTFLFTRVFDLMVVAGFLLVISLVANAYVRTKRLEKKLEQMVRNKALDKTRVKKQE